MSKPWFRSEDGGSTDEGKRMDEVRDDCYGGVRLKEVSWTEDSAVSTDESSVV